MTETEILKKLDVIFREVFDDDELTLSMSTSAKDIDEWDSLNQIKIILACEREFTIRIRPRQVNELKDIGEMVAFIADRIN